MKNLFVKLSSLIAVAIVFSLSAIGSEVSTWDPVAGNNNKTPPNGWPSGTMLPTQVEPTAREMMAAIKRWYDTVPLIYTVKSGGSIQTALTSAASTGGIVQVQAGTYTLAAPLTISSNTELRCDPGAILAPNSSGWVGSTVTVINANHGAVSITDHDISVNGCTFTPGGTFATDGAFHHINIRMARRLRITRNTFNGGGDGTAFQATDDTDVTNNTMLGAYNACYDHWEGPTNMRVEHNYCSTRLYGVLVTGTDTTNTTSQVAADGSVSNNQILVTIDAGAAIWLNGLGGAGSGAKNITVAGNSVSGSGIHFVCFYATGGGTANDVFTGNSCSSGTSGSVGGLTGTDGGGAASNISFIGNTFKGLTIAAGDIGVIQLGGVGDSASNNRIIGGTYPSAFYIHGTGNVVFGNYADAGSAGLYNTTGATSPTILDPVSAASAWSAYTPTLSCDGGTLTTTTVTGAFNQIGKIVSWRSRITLTNVGTCTPNLRIALPATAKTAQYVANCREITGGTLFQLYADAIGGLVSAIMQRYDNSGGGGITNGNIYDCSGQYEAS